MHLPEAEVMWDFREEFATEFIYYFYSVIALELGHDFLEDGVALEDAGFGKLPQGHLVGVIADFLHLFGHHPHVEDQSDQFLHGGWECGCRAFPLNLALLLLLGLFILLVVHLYLLVGLLLFIQFLIVFLEGQFLILVIHLTALALHTYSAPTREEDELRGHCFVLQ
jgi:hypothetical protein